MRRTLIAVAAVITTVAAAVAVASAPAGAHLRRTTYSVTSTTPAGATPHFPAFDRSSGHVLVSNVATSSLSELEIGRGPTRTFGTGVMPHTVAVDDATRRGFVTNKGASSVSVIDLSTGAVSSFAVGPNPHGLALDARYGRLYVTSIDADRLEVYDVSTFALITTVPVGEGPWGVSVGQHRIAVTDTGGDTVHILDRKSLRVRDVVTVGAGPWNSAFLGNTLYVTLERSGEVVAVRGDSIVWRAQVGASPHGIVADNVRRTVLAAVTGTNTVAVLDASRGTVLQNIPVAAGPAGLAITPDGRVFVGNQQAGVVTEISPRRDG